MDVDKIQKLVKELIKLMEKSEIGEITVDEGDVRVSLRKQAEQVVSTIEEKGAEALSSRVGSGKSKYPDNWKKITAPMVGTFYRASAPGADPFVEIDDEVEEGQTVCIVEAMKLMNEITTEEKGIIKDILVENGRPVEFGQTLFLYEPAS